ncbi:11998_t:CDS:2 [Entrophospora sp. SA101]|nr:11998_t:CDS:2 [Entrophospora sp. SA101]
MKKQTDKEVLANTRKSPKNPPKPKNNYMKEIIVIEVENSQKVRTFLEQQQINYQTYHEGESEEEY